MKESKCFVVVAATDYEGYSALKAFYSEQLAQDFADQCTAYKQTHSGWVDSSLPQAEWDAAHEVMMVWEAAHPARPHCRADRYEVQVLPFIAADEQFPHGATVKLNYNGDDSCIGWAHRGANGELLSAYGKHPLDPNSWFVVEERVA